MAYARFRKNREVGIGRSDVYVWGDGAYIYCSSCRIMPMVPFGDHMWYPDFKTTSRLEMLTHLYQHRQRRSAVPFHATRRLKREIRKYGDLVCL